MRKLKRRLRKFCFLFWHNRGPLISFRVLFPCCLFSPFAFYFEVRCALGCWCLTGGWSVLSGVVSCFFDLRVYSYSFLSAVCVDPRAPCCFLVSRL